MTLFHQRPLPGHNPLQTMMVRHGCRLLILFGAMLLCDIAFAQEPTSAFAWPEGQRVALSLSFDDARPSQVEVGTALLDSFGVKATFFVLPAPVEQDLEGWKRAVAGGHEIGNHSLNHPCTGNFPWAREKALEAYTLAQMHDELVAANARIEALLGVTPETFAYPCGQTFVGRGPETASYVPLVAALFTAGRGWLDEGPNDPGFTDLAQVLGMEMDGKDFAQIKPLLESARENGQWVVLAGHEMRASGYQTTRLEMLERLIPYAQDPANQVWLAPVGTVARYILQQRGVLR